MSSTTATPWTADAFAPGELYVDADADTELAPYRVRFGDDVYDQSAFTDDIGHRYQAFIGGIGSGKTVGGIMRMAAHVTRWNPGELGAIVTPTALGIKNTILPKLHRWGFMDAGWEYHGPQSEAPGLHTPNGTRILLESANTERKIHRLRGYDLAWFWIDEPRNVPGLAFDVLMGRLRVGEYRNGFLTSTPAGRSNWLFDRLHPEGENTLSDLKGVMGVPTVANPHLPVDYRRDLRSEYSGQFARQEIEGAFVKPEGVVYPWFDDDTNVRSAEGVPEYFDRFLYGVDWGFHPHPAVILAIGVRDGEYWILREHYETRNTVEDLRDVLVGTENRPGWFDDLAPGPVYCDPSEPENLHKFDRAGIDARKADNAVDPGIKHVTVHAENLCVLETCQATINEFGQYQYGDDGDPVKENDHAMDALRYTLFSDDQRDSSGELRSLGSMTDVLG